jgi:uncharacterized protein DUF3300
MTPGIALQHPRSWHHLARIIALLTAVVLLVFSEAVARGEEGYFAPQGGDAFAPSAAELDQLLAPVALYPDALLGNVLAASTYPLEVIALQRWLDRNPGLTPQELEQAVASQPWDASVKSLAPFASVVAMMNGELDWMSRLGNAFLADQAGVMDAVQRLRRKAVEAGGLQDNPRERVVMQSDIVTIEPTQPDVVYVPVYDPRIVYGPWWWPGYPPYAWSTFYFGPWDYVVGGIAFGIGIPVWGSWHDHHPHPDWHQHHLVDHRPGGSSVWRHDSDHRRGAPYPDSRTRDRYRPPDRGGSPDRGASHDRRDFRGFDVRPQGPSSRNAPGLQPAPRPEAGGSRIQRAPDYRQAPQPQGYGPSQRAPAQRAPEISRSSPIQRAPSGSSSLHPVPGNFSSQQSQRGHQSLGSAPSGNPAARTQRSR